MIPKAALALLVATFLNHEARADQSSPVLPGQAMAQSQWYLCLPLNTASFGKKCTLVSASTCAGGLPRTRGPYSTKQEACEAAKDDAREGAVCSVYGTTGCD